jgi:hypothetical protein
MRRDGTAMGRGSSASGRPRGRERSRKRGAWPLSLLVSVVLHAGMIAGVIIAFWPAGVLIALGPGGDGAGAQTGAPIEERLVETFLTGVASQQISTPPSTTQLDLPEVAKTSAIFASLSSSHEGGGDDSNAPTADAVAPVEQGSATFANKPSEPSPEFNTSVELIARAPAPDTEAISKQTAAPPSRPVARARHDKKRSTKRQQVRRDSEHLARSTRVAERQAALGEATRVGLPASTLTLPPAVSPETEPAHPKIGLPPVEPTVWLQGSTPSHIAPTLENGTPARDERTERLRRMRPIPLLGWSR